MLLNCFSLEKVSNWCLLAYFFKLFWYADFKNKKSKKYHFNIFLSKNLFLKKYSTPH
jgi:hypothetical protein